MLDTFRILPTKLTGLFSLAMLLVGCLAPASALAEAPSFDCKQAKGAVEALICKDEGLAALDLKLDSAWKTAKAKASQKRLKPLLSDQRNWLKTRGQCSKAKKPRDCLERHYQARIARLQGKPSS